MATSSLPTFRLCAALLAAVFTGRAQFKPADSAQTQPAQAQTPPIVQPLPPKSPGERPTFAIKVNLVRLLVSVRDATGKPVADLNKQDFRVMDSGVPQPISLFERNTSVPLSVAILIDTSGSTERELHYETESVQRFITTLVGSGNAQDTFALFSFNWRTNLEVDFSRNQKRAEHALHALRGEGGTSLYDAVYLASDSLTGREGRHVMIVVTDGGDTTSYKKYPDALMAAQMADVVMYPVVVLPILSDAGRNVGGEHALATLAASTGGRIFNPQGFDRLNQAFEEIIQELRTQYLLGFYPENVREEPRRYHPVAVGARDGSLQISARSGYYEP